MSLVVVLREPLGLPIGFPLAPFLNGKELLKITDILVREKNKSTSLLHL